MSDFCPKCGTQLRDGAGFCVKCGYKLVKKENTITAPKEKNKKKKNVSEIDNQVVNSVVADETKIDSIQKIEQNKRPEEHEKLFNESVSEDIKAEKEYVEKPVDNQRVSVEKKTAKDIDDALSSVGDAHAMGNKNSSKSIIIIAIVALLLGVGGFCYFKIIQPKTKENQ